MELLTHYYKEKTMSKELTLLGNKNTKYDFVGLRSDAGLDNDV